MIVKVRRNNGASSEIRDYEGVTKIEAAGGMFMLCDEAGVRCTVPVGDIVSITDEFDASGE